MSYTIYIDKHGGPYAREPLGNWPAYPCVKTALSATLSFDLMMKVIPETLRVH